MAWWRIDATSPVRWGRGRSRYRDVFDVVRFLGYLWFGFKLEDTWQWPSDCMHLKYGSDQARYAIYRKMVNVPMGLWCFLLAIAPSVEVKAEPPAVSQAQHGLFVRPASCILVKEKQRKSVKAQQDGNGGMNCWSIEQLCVEAFGGSAAETVTKWCRGSLMSCGWKNVENVEKRGKMTSRLISTHLDPAESLTSYEPNQPVHSHSTQPPAGRQEPAPGPVGGPGGERRSRVATADPRGHGARRRAEGALARRHRGDPWRWVGRDTGRVWKGMNYH